MQSSFSERQLTLDEIDNFALQAVGYQDVLDANGFPVEGELTVPRMLFSALGPNNARIVTERMIAIRNIPEEMEIAKAAAQRVWEASQARRA